MPSLVINAPKQQVILNNKKSFQETLNSGIGQGYAINTTLFRQIYPGCRLVLLSKDQRRRAEGELVKLVPTYKTNNNIQRYDVYIKDLRIVSYKPVSLNRNGVAVIR